MRLIRTVIFAHILASYTFAVVSLAVTFYQSGPGLGDAGSFILTNPWSLLLAPVTAPYGLALSLQFCLQGTLYPHQVLLIWAEYLIPLLCFYYLLRRLFRGERRGFPLLDGQPQPLVRIDGKRTDEEAGHQ